LAILGFIYNSLAEKEIGTGLGKVSAGKFTVLTESFSVKDAINVG